MKAAEGIQSPFHESTHEANDSKCYTFIIYGIIYDYLMFQRTKTSVTILAKTKDQEATARYALIEK